MQGNAKPKREESIYCASACDMLRMSLEDATSLCDIYPAVSVNGTAPYATATSNAALLAKLVYNFFFLFCSC
jgi:hypothetical protein